MAVLAGQGQVLLVHRHPDRRFYPNCWDLPGGHIEPEESPEEAVRRECLEEIGVNLRGVRPVPMSSSDPLLEVHAFLATSWEGAPSNLAPDEHDDLRWFRPHELSGPVLADPASQQDIIRAAERGSE
jgi:8-oxo-dGTP diphosphatase